MYFYLKLNLQKFVFGIIIAFVFINSKKGKDENKEVQSKKFPGRKG
jgi:hypothetical protein